MVYLLRYIHVVSVGESPCKGCHFDKVPISLYGKTCIRFDCYEKQFKQITQQEYNERMRSQQNEMLQK